MNDEVTAIASKLFNLRAGRSADLIADRSGISSTALRSYENGKCVPGAIALKRLAEFYEVSADYILGLSDIAGAGASEKAARAKAISEAEEALNALITIGRRLAAELERLRR